ncbi:MAG: phasin family protein [Thermoanaerobaculia bacterium]|nr:phasin family protein [Thermoanaerobaculia bacterium]
MFKTLVERGDKREKAQGIFTKPLAKPLETARERVKELGHELDERFQGTMNATLKRFGVPSSHDVQELIARVEKLTSQVESLAAQR